ncbi:MAG: hypothetical protein M3522_14365 [Actinomycetota bacterium]|nr:hypothetical protein [Actinomycetota bacterium]
MTKTSTRRRGPKTPGGKIAVRLNAATHGILSASPVVNEYERAEDWEGHRRSVVDSLGPDDGMEQVLAERVALCSWRLNRVVLYESERASELQEGVVESVRERRKRRLETEQLFARAGDEVLTDLGILVEAHPINALEDASMARRLYRAVERLFDAPPEAAVKGGDGAAILDEAARHAVKQVAYQAGEEPAGEDVVERAEALLDRLPGAPQEAFLEDLDYTIGRLRQLVGWLAVEAGGTPDSNTVDGSGIEPEEAVMEALHTAARHDAAIKATKAEKAEAELLAERRARILLEQADLEKIARYEAHLSRQMYQALHELEALQARRVGKAAPLARLDVQT